MTLLIKNAAIVRKATLFKGSLLVKNGRIVSFLKEGKLPSAGIETVVDAKGAFLLPGFFETHFHGIRYRSFFARTDTKTFKQHPSPDSVSDMLAYLPKLGVTSTLISAYAAPEKSLSLFFKSVKKYQAAHHSGHTRFHGIDLEGNFIKNPLFAGAQDARYFHQPSVALFEQWQTLCGGAIRKALIAPEWGTPAFRLIRHLFRQAVIPSVGHTGCTRDELLKAYDCGTRVVVHTGNGPMSQNFKQGGALDAIFELGDKLYGEIICDLKHVHAAWIHTFIKCYSTLRMLAVSDADHLSGTGLKNGTRIGPWVVRDNALWMRDKPDTLAGSLTPLDRDFENMMNLFTRDRKAYFQEKSDPALRLEAALPLLCRLFSLNAAELFELDKEIGSIEAGKRADFMLAGITGRPGHYSFKIDSVFIAGERVF